MEESRILEPGEATAFEVETGDVVTLRQVEGQQVADFLSFGAADPANRLSMYMSRAVNYTWQLTEGHVLVSTDGDDMWEIIRDTVRQNYSGGGYCNPYVNERRSSRPEVPNCEENLVGALKPFGLGRRDMDHDMCLNVFMRVDYNPDGSWIIAEPACRAGDDIEFRACMPQVLALSICPQLLNPVNAFRLKTLELSIRRE